LKEIAQETSEPGAPAGSRRVPYGTGGRDAADLAVVVTVAGARADPSARDLDVGDVPEGADRRAWPTHDASPPVGRAPRLRLAVLPQPLVDVGDEVADLSPDVNTARPFAGQASVVQRPDRHTSRCSESSSMLISGSRPLKVGVVLSMPGRCAEVSAPLRAGRGDSAPDPGYWPGDASWIGFADTEWTLDQVPQRFQARNP
jgi:hypothetical protein